MPPPNLTWETAILIPTLSSEYNSVQENIHEAGVTYNVWYKYLPVEDDKVIGYLFYGDPDTYKPDTEAYIDDLEGWIQILGGGYDNCQGQLPTITNRMLYFKINTNTGNPNPATLHINLKRAQDNVNQARTGDILVRTASLPPWMEYGGYTEMPLAYVNKSSGIILGFREYMPPGEAGDYMPGTGEILFSKEYPVPPYELRLYRYNLDLKTTLSYIWQGSTPYIRTNRELKKFYVGNKGYAGGQIPAEFFTMDKEGVVTAPTVMTGHYGMTAIASSPDGAYIYVSTIDGTGAIIKKWDVIAGAFTTNFAAGVLNYTIADMLVMKNGDVIVLYQRTSIDSVYVRIYDSAGIILRTYTVEPLSQVTQPARLGYANDDSITFWLWLHLSTGFSNFRNIRVSDLQVVVNIQTPDNTYNEIDHGANPEFRFVTSDTCPFVLLISQEGGIYEIRPPLPSDPPGRHDNYNGDISEKIPNPTFRTALIGD